MSKITELKEHLSEMQSNMENTGHLDYCYLMRVIDVIWKLIAIVESNDKVLTDHLRNVE